MRQLVCEGRAREGLLLQLREDWLEQERRSRLEHQDQTQGLLQEVQELILENKLLLKEKEEDQVKTRPPPDILPSPGSNGGWQAPAREHEEED